MSAFYLLSDDGKPALNDEAEAISKLQEGRLSPDAYYWKEGMAEWKPLRELVPHAVHFVPARRDGTAVPKLAQPHLSQPQALKAPSESKTKSPAYFLRKELQPWTALLEIMIAACLIIYLAGLWNVLLNHTSGNVLDIPPSWLIASLAIVLLKSVFFYIWVFRCYKNCRGFTANIRFSSGWAVGYFFIPIWNLFRPYQVMQEIWKISTNPYRAQSNNDSYLVGIWWGLYLLINLITVFINHPPQDNLELNSKIIAVTYCGVASVFSLLTLILVHGVYVKQKRLTRE